MGGLVARNGWVDLATPAIDATGQIASAKSLRAKPLRGHVAAYAMVAIHDELARAVQTIELRRQIVHREQLGRADAAQRPFPGFANIEQLHCRLAQAPVELHRFNVRGLRQLL